MAVGPTVLKIRSKKIGVLLRAARLAASKSTMECAEAIGVPVEGYEAFELGEDTPSLPELEVLAFFLETPLEYFWSDHLNLPAKNHASLQGVEQLIQLRKRIIGASLKQARMEAGLSLEEVADKAGIAIEQLKSFEIGEQSIPVPVLEALGRVLHRSIKDFQDTRSQIAKQAAQRNTIHQFLELSPELQDFVTKPVNRPYLELAQRLSEMSVEKLRMVAEGLLEITL